MLPEKTYTVFQRPYNIGMGWRKIADVVAYSPANACDRVYNENISEKNQPYRTDGTKKKPFIFNGGASEIYAELSK